jgi:hypothetical protein
MKAKVLAEVKKEVEKMLEAEFIRPCRYAEWISSIVPVQKKDGRWRVYVDFRDLNRTTLKDEYPMPGIRDIDQRSCWSQDFEFHGWQRRL